MEPPPRAYRWIVAGVRGLLRAFFRRVQVTGVENVPATGGGLVVAWHPNGLLDPALILAHFPGRVVFGARHGLLRVPLLGRVMKALGTVPIYRREDAPGGRNDHRRRLANERSLDALARAVSRGAFAVLFPEGVSHDEPDLLQLKHGAARLYHRACRLAPQSVSPAILPVGLHYDKKGVFGSNALLVFHPPLPVPVELRPPAEDGQGDDERTRAARLTAEIEQELREVVYGTESWQLNQLMHRARKLVRAERAARCRTDSERPDMVERILGFARLWQGYRVRCETHPEATAELVAQIEGYDEHLRALGLEDHELDAVPRLGSPWVPLLILLQALLVYLLLPPFLLIGYAVNLPTALLVLSLAKLSSKAYKDEATMKLLVGAVAFPATWLAIALLAGWGQGFLHQAFPRFPDAPWLTGGLAFALSAFGGSIALVYQRLVVQTARAIRVRLTRQRSRQAIARLRRERRRLFAMVMELAEGLDLPGTVGPDGRILPAAGPPRQQPRPGGRTRPPPGA